MIQIIAFSGKKQSGKSTIVNFLHGYEMKRHGFIKDFKISSDGQLIVNALYKNENDQEFESLGIFDLNQDTPSFVNYATSTFWPFIKGYNFADPLKRFCMAFFGLTKEQCYGTEKQKNSLTPYLWENMPGVITNPIKLSSQGGRSSIGRKYEELVKSLTCHAAGPMTAREFMQFVGTDMCRKIKDTIWVDLCINQIKKESPEVALIGDCRFENEIDVVHDNDGKVIYLTRNFESGDSHLSENADRFIDKYDLVLDNSKLNIDEQCQAVLEQLYSWGILHKISPVL
jgi:hypothetical protein